MPSPKKSTKSPARSRSRGRSKSASRKKTSSRSRSRSSGRKPKPAASEIVETKDIQVVTVKSPSRRKPKSPSRSDNKEVTLTKHTVTSAIYSSTVLSAQELTAVTPVRSSVRMLAATNSKKDEVIHRKEQVNSDVSSDVRAPPPKEYSKTKNKRAQYEFMGPVGAFFIVFFLPLVVYYLNLACSKGKCSVLDLPNLSRRLVLSFFEVEATLIYLGWFFFQVFLALLPVGRVFEGQPLKSGGRLRYRCNGLFALIVSLIVLGAAVYFQCPVTKVYDKFFQLITAAIVTSFSLSIFLYVRSRYVSQDELAPGGNTGNILYDFFIGRELNPRIGPLDLKFFCELRPGLIGWVALDWIFVIKDYQETGTLSPNLVLVTLFQTLYVGDALWFEDAVLTTMDIIHDGFGFMLVFGDLTWVPFLYCLQPRFIYESKFVLPWYCLAPIVLLNMVGYLIFRLANSQKNRFRNSPNHPSLSGLETIPTPTNKKLLVSGWWGICHKPNYLGDLIMALSWSLTTGFGQIITYFYPIYFLILLIHRERRDNEHCRKKYGASWDRYCERVKYRIFPYIY